MGLYWYTMRKGTKTVDGIELGRFDFAYKDFFLSWNPPDGWKRLAGRSHASAARARQANPDVKYYVNATSFKEAADCGYPVFKMKDPDMAEYLEETADKIVGYLTKIGHKYQINWKT